MLESSHRCAEYRRKTKSSERLTTTKRAAARGLQSHFFTVALIFSLLSAAQSASRDDTECRTQIGEIEHNAAVISSSFDLLRGARRYGFFVLEFSVSVRFSVRAFKTDTLLNLIATRKGCCTSFHRGAHLHLLHPAANVHHCEINASFSCEAGAASAPPRLAFDGTTRLHLSAMLNGSLRMRTRSLYF